MQLDLIVYWVSRATRLLSTNECGTKTMNTTTRHVASGTEFLANQSTHPGKEPVWIYL
jgi:hypothetical protein